MKPRIDLDEAEFDVLLGAQVTDPECVRFGLGCETLRERWRGTPAGRADAAEFVAGIRAIGGQDMAELADSLARFFDEPAGGHRPH